MEMICFLTASIALSIHGARGQGYNYRGYNDYNIPNYGHYDKYGPHDTPPEGTENGMTGTNYDGDDDYFHVKTMESFGTGNGWDVYDVDLWRCDQIGQPVSIGIPYPSYKAMPVRRIDINYNIRLGLGASVHCIMRFVQVVDYVSIHFKSFNIVTQDRSSRVQCLKREKYARLKANGELLTPCGQSVAFTVSNKLKFDLFVNRDALASLKSVQSVSVTILFHELTLSDMFRHVQTDVNAGYVTTFMFDGQLLHNFEELNAAFAIRILSRKQVLMISFSHFDINCDHASVRLFRARSRSDVVSLGVPMGYSETNASVVRTYFDVVGTKCGFLAVGAQTLDVSIFLALETNQRKILNTGFKMLYSIHNISQAPQQLQPGHFNCTVPFFAQFAHHLSCNLRVECQGGEDEKNCSYASDECGPGYIDAGKKCYKYFLVEREYSWDEAADFCSQKKMTLVSPQTPQEWDLFSEILSRTTNSSLFFVGLQTSTLSELYTYLWQWADGTTAFYNTIIVFEPKRKPLCAFVLPVRSRDLQFFSCETSTSRNETSYTSANVLCESRKPSTVNPLPSPRTNFTYFGQEDVDMIKCSDGHYVKDFLSCGHCGTQRHVTLCETPAAGGVAMFRCGLDLEDGQTIPYTLVCDYRQHCDDGSDETFCKYDTCHERQCRTKQCVTYDQWCDGMKHCVDGSDQECSLYIDRTDPILFTEPPAVVHLDGYGGYSLSPLRANDTCPDSHFNCADGFCIPVFLRCNGHYDCLDHQDEADCDSYKCPGYYRCYDSTICVHGDNVCDGIFHCPQQDDELLCNFTCPQGCRCQGLAFVCDTSFPVSHYRKIRYLDISGSGMTLSNLTENFYLVGLDLSSSGLSHLQEVSLPNLRLLDLSSNLLKHVSVQSFQGFPNLRELRLSDNPLQSLQADDIQPALKQMRDLDLSWTHIGSYHSDMLSKFPDLMSLNLSNAGVSAVTANGFNSTTSLEVLDLRGCPMTDFPRHVFQSLTVLRLVHASNYKLCCTENLPINFNLRNCYAPEDELASCDDLLRSDTYRVSLWVMATLAFAGNIASLAMRQRRKSTRTSFDVFVTNLNVADLLMGVYLVIVGLADHVYRGDYLWRDDSWKTSPVCKMAGFLSLLSSESSACLICLITLDRFLAVRFVFSSFRFGVRGALLACGVMWTFTASLSAIPLLPMTSHWEFFSQNGICLPLPVTRKVFQGHAYSFGIMIVLNMVLFVLIAAGQLAIYKAVRGNSFMSDKNNDKEATIARRLITIALSDFLCWFPVGCLGILAYKGTAFPSEVNVGLAIFVLPFNSALNPFLYTLNIFLEKRRKAARARMMEQLVKRLASERQVKHVGTTTACDDWAD